MSGRRTRPRPPGARQPRGQGTRTRLLKAAHVLFLNHGFHGTSMRQIARSAGLAVSGIYNHFRSKEDIFAAVLDAYHPYHVVLPALETTEAESVEAFVREAARRVRAGTQGAATRLMPLVFIELVEFQGRHLKQLAEKLAPTLQAHIRRFAVRRGQLRPVPPPVMFRTFLAMLTGFLMSEMVLRGSPLLRGGRYDWFGGMVEIYLHGIVADTADAREASPK